MSMLHFSDMVGLIQEKMKLPKTYLGKELTLTELMDLSAFSISICNKVDPDIISDTLGDFEKKGIPFENIRYIAYAISLGFDRTVYENPKFNVNQLMYILYGDLLGLDTSICANEKFDYYQMATLLVGMFNGIDVKPYADPAFSQDKMKEIQKAIQDGFEIMNYVGVDSSIEEIIAIHSLLKVGRDKNIDVVKYLDMPFNYRQLYEIIKGLSNELDVSIYADPKYSYKKMDLILFLLSKNISLDFEKIPDNLKKDIYPYIYKFIRYGVNPEKYLNYKIGQLYEITKGLKEGLDISQFDDISLSKDEMKKIRQKLYNEKMSKYQAI